MTRPDTLSAPKPAVTAPWLLMVVLVAGHAVKHIYSAAFFVILPEISTALGLSNTALGAISTARNMAGSVANLPAGFLADRYSRHWGAVLGITMIAAGVFNFAMGASASYWPLLITATLFGATISFWHPPAIAALSQRFPQRRGFAISLHGMGGSIGEAGGPLIVGVLLLVITWSSLLQVSSAPAIATGVVVWLLMSTMRGQTSGGLRFLDYLRSIRTLFRTRMLITVLVVTGVYSMVQGAVNTFLPVYLRIDLGYSALQMTAFVSAAQVAGIVSQPVLGLLSDRFGRAWVLTPGLFLLGTGVLGVAFAPPGFPLLLAVILMGAFQFPMMSLFLATAMDAVGEGVQATTVSLVFGIGTVFGSLSPSLAGVLADSFGIQYAFVYGAAMAFTASILSLGTRRRHV